MRKINFSWITAGYLVFLGLILLATTSHEPEKPKQMLILTFDNNRDMKAQSEFLFKKGWIVKDMEPFIDGLPSYSSFIVIYEK